MYVYEQRLVRSIVGAAIVGTAWLMLPFTCSVTAAYFAIANVLRLL